MNDELIKRLKDDLSCWQAGLDADWGASVTQALAALEVANARIAELEAAAKAEPVVDSDFKNFHRLLCERFGYAHDEQDWRRDQLSLIEWIANSKKKVASIKIEEIMDQAQVFASAWSLVGGLFDSGDALENANQEKADLRGMLRVLFHASDYAAAPAALAQPLEAQADELSLRAQYEDACIAANKNARDAERIAELECLLGELAKEFVRVFPIYYYAEPWAHDKNAVLKAAQAALSQKGEQG